MPTWNTDLIILNQAGEAFDHPGRAKPNLKWLWDFCAILHASTRSCATRSQDKKSCQVIQWHAFAQRHRIGNGCADGGPAHTNRRARSPSLSSNFRMEAGRLRLVGGHELS